MQVQWHSTMMYSIPYTRFSINNIIIVSPDFVKVCKGQGKNGCEKSGGVEKWLNDDACDDENNTEACGWDGGDCCGNSAADWDENCFVSLPI